jgi:hypothetical protein
MDRLRRAHELIETAPFENAPPIVAFTTVALGGFRGLLADYLWLRATRLQEQGNYFELVQLASWIVKLQPRFTGATAFLAWNMAYNISVTFNDFEDRWRWVRRGIELIRDEAQVYNPKDPELFKELSWIYLHKLGQDMDDANRYYKTQLALFMTDLLGEPPVDWVGLTQAPASRDALREKLGEKAKLWKSLEDSGLSLADVEEKVLPKGEIPAELKFGELPAKEQQTFRLYLRRLRLLKVAKLDVARMVALNQKYGKLDWRLPQAHGIYWAARGMDAAHEGKDLNCERMIFQGLNAAFKSGRLIFLKDVQTLETTPNLDLLEAARNSYLDSMAKHPDNNSVRSGYENFLIDAVVVCYTFGQRQKASACLAEARNTFGYPRYHRSLEEFVLAELAEDMSTATYAQGQGAVQGYLIQSCYALALGDEERAAAYELIARKLHRKYMLSIGASTTERRGLPPYAQMKSEAVDRCLGMFPPGVAQRLRDALPQFKAEGEEPAGAVAPEPKP